VAVSWYLSHLQVHYYIAARFVLPAGKAWELNVEQFLVRYLAPLVLVLILEHVSLQV
jgi:hypothetical protein